MMNSEIVTAVAEGLKLTIGVVDNHGYQCVLGLQRICGVADFVDAVVIVTPTDTHARLIEVAVSAGRAVFSEKPIALDLAEPF